MAGFTTTTHVQASPAKTFEVFTDLRRAPERVDGILKLEVLGDGAIGRGTRFRETRKVFGKEATEEMEITAFEPGRSYTVECGSCGAHYRTAFDFRGSGTGTDVVTTFSVKPESLFAKLMSPLAGLGVGMMRKMFEKDLAQLKQFAETGDAGGA